MIRLIFPLIVLLQAYCLYHAFKYERENKWFFLIVFLPFIGSMIYLYINVLNEPSIEEIGETIKETIEPSYKTETLEKKAAFADTYANKLKLGDEYLERSKFLEAIALFESCLSGFNKENPEIFRRLLKAHYLNKDYLSAAKYGQKLEGSKNFEKTDEKIAYAWSLHFLNNREGAEAAFKTMDIFFSNYKQRFEYAAFLFETERDKDSKEKLEELLEEFEQMDNYERKMKKDIYLEIKGLHKRIAKT